MKMKIQVVDVDYRINDNTPTVRIFAKNSEGENVVLKDTEFRPYFYAFAEDSVDDLKEELEDRVFTEDDEKLPVTHVEKVERIDGADTVEILKVYTSIPPKIPKLRGNVAGMEEVTDTREFDIPFYKRYLIDREIDPVTWIQVEAEEQGDEYIVDSIGDSVDAEKPEFETLAFDLEVYDDRIIMASFYSRDFQKLLTTADIDRDFVEKVEDEAALLKRFMEIIEERDIEILTGYNTDEFDFSILRERAEHHGLTLSLGRNGERMKFDRRGRFSSARLKGRMHLDIYPFVAHVLAQGLESETLTLDAVAEELLGRNKDEMSWEDMKKSWKNREDLEKFADYALKDSELAYELAEELVPQMMELAQITGLIPFDACRLTYGQLTENFLLREAYERNMVAPNRPFQKERQKRRRQGAYSGGYVYTPDAGLYDNIALLDFRSLYPTVMVAHNISPETLNMEDCKDEYVVEEFDYSFCQDEQGFFPELIQGLVEDRARLKKKMAELDEDTVEHTTIYSRQQAEKILANSFYGYLGYEGARWYSREAAEATTYLGRKYIKEAVEKADKNGFDVVYGDTDSLFIRKDNLRDEVDGFLEDVNSELPEFMELELEGYFTTGFFTSTDSGEGAKKKYALMAEDGNMKITGFEQVRRDWSPIAKNTQKKVLEKVLQDEPEEAAEIVKNTIQKLKDGEIPVDELKIYTTLTKKPEEYGSTAPHVEAAKKAMKRGDTIKPGTTVDYVITRGGGTISDRAELTKYADSYDSEYYIDNQIVPASLRALKVFGYTENQLKGQGKQSGLGRFS
jgi:DNA polymerase Pol2